MAAATVMAVSLVPALCTLLLSGKAHREEDNPVMRALQWLYRPVLRWALGHRAITLTLALALFGGALFFATPHRKRVYAAAQ